jgi:hypothetical protein
MKTCECGNTVADNAKTCPKCGHRFGSVFLKTVLVCVVGIFAFILLLGYLSGPSDIHQEVESWDKTCKALHPNTGHQSDADAYSACMDEAQRTHGQHFQ